MYDKTRIDVVTGFLGAGKTSLIRKMVDGAYPGERLAIIQNEYGEEGFEGTFLDERKINMSGITSGCVCCSGSGNLITSIETITDWVSPDRIFLETAGTAKLSEVLDIIGTSCRAFVELSSIITVVDASKFKMYLKNYKGFYDDQIENSACVVLTRASDMPQDKLKEITSAIRDLNPQVGIVSESWDGFTSSEMRETVEFSAAV